MLAIIIPYYKLTFFEETVESLSNQTDKRFKVYIGDDASPENPKDLLEKYQGQFDFSYHRFEGNLGGKSLVSQWDRCVALSKEEEWIMILGDDDVLEGTVVESFYKNQETFYGKTNVIRFASKKIFGKEIVDNAVFVHPVWENATTSFYRKFEKKTRSSLSEYIFSRTSFLKYGFYDYPLAWNSDDRAWLDFSDNKPIFTINESIVFFRLSSINISGRQDNLSVKNVSEIEFYKFMITHKLKKYNKEQKLRLLRRYQSELRKTRNLKVSEFFFLLFFYLKYVNVDWIGKFHKKVFNKFMDKIKLFIV
jgi:glycosyltransferase involved in cell wall biosynthesis